MRVHSHFRTGYLEEVYKNALLVELKEMNLLVADEVDIPIDYHGVRVGNYKADIIVEKCVILELKVATQLIARHEAQLVNYLTATGIDDGLLLNFGTPSLEFKHKYRVMRFPLKSNPENSVRGNSPSPTLSSLAHPVNPVEKNRTEKSS